MTTVKEDLGQGPEGTGEGQPGQSATGTPGPQVPRRWRPTLAPLAGLVRRHWLFSLVLVAALSFGGPATTQGHIKLSGVATPNAGTTGSALCANTSAYYVNFHTTAFPGGAIRGQLH